MKGVIVAAGLSSRIRRDMELDVPKCMMEINGKAIIDRVIETFISVGIDEIAIVVGWNKEKIIDHVGTDVTYIFNPFYAFTNNMASLWCVKRWVGKSIFLYTHSDVIYNPKLIEMTIAGTGEINLLLDPSSIDDEAMKVKLDASRSFLESSKQIPASEAYGEWTGLIKFGNRGWTEMVLSVENKLKEGRLQAYDTEAINCIPKKAELIRVIDTNGLPWIEIDTKRDYEKEKKLFE